MHENSDEHSDTRRSIKIGLLAGEASGDILGAGLISELKQRFPQAEFVGIGGPLMQREGLQSLHDMSRLSVMGLVEPIKRLPDLLKLRSSIVRYFKHNPPDVFIGIDAPDFNLGVEGRLKKQGIKTVHYVSPSVWAWRKWRIKKIKKAVDHMLCMFPFEADFYTGHQVPVTFVGHPMADDIDLDIDKIAAKKSLGVPLDGLLLAVLPGSRSQEIEHLSPLFLEVVKTLQEQNVLGEVAIAAVSESAYRRIQNSVDAQGVEARIFLGRAREVLLAADVALAASGTVTLESTLTKTPMVVGYRMESFSYWVISRLVSLEHVALPNILTGDSLVNEFLQSNATPEAIAADLTDLIEDTSRREEMAEAFYYIHERLKRNANARAAEVIHDLIVATKVE